MLETFCYILRSNRNSAASTGRCRIARALNRYRGPALELKPLRAGQYRQVAEWEFGPQSDDTDWPRYVAEMNSPQWMHFGIYSFREFVGALSLEKTGDRAAAFHVVTARRKVHPRALADILIQVGGRLFDREFTLLSCSVPRAKRAAARLALRCGMRRIPAPADEPNINFICTKGDFQNGIKQTGAGQGAVSTDANQYLRAAIDRADA